MDFLFVSAQYLPTVGGVELYTNNLALALAAMGHSVTIATSSLPGLPAQESMEKSIRVVRLPSILFFKGRMPMPRPGRAFHKAAAALWDRPYDACLVQTRLYGLSLWAA